MKKYISKLPALFLLICSFAGIYLGINENGPKGVMVLGLCIIALLIIRLKDNLSAGIIFLILSFPISISLLIPTFLEDAYVGGIFVNYLAPTIYLQDIAVLLIFLSLFQYIDIRRIGKITKYILVAGAIFWLFHNIFFGNILILFNSSRMFLYLITLLLLYECREIFLEKLKEMKKIIVLLTVLILASELFLSLGQIVRGADLGLTMLGESDVAAGIVNTSSIDLYGRLFLRGYGTFPHPNLLGGFGALIFTLSGIFYWSKREISFFWYVFLAVLSFLVSFVSFSQGSWLVIGVNVLLIALSEIYSRFVKGGKKTHLLTSIPFILTSEERSISERIALIESTIEYFTDNYLFGVGSGNFVSNFYPYAPQSESRLSLLQPVHNIFLLIFVEYGILIGSLLNLGVLLFFLYKIIRSNYKVAVFSLFIFIFIIGMVDHYLITLPQGLIMALAAILVASLIK